MSTKTLEKKRSFKMPHVLFLLLAILMVMSILTYIIPPGEFAVDAEGNIIGSEFHFLETRTPVSPLGALNYIYYGLMNQSSLVALLLCLGGCVNIIMSTNVIGRVIDYILYKLQDKGVNVIVPILFMVFVLIGAFGGGDALIPLIPLGMVLAAKLRLDPIVAFAFTVMAPSLGFATSPVTVYMAQIMADIPVFSGFGVRLAITLVIGLIGMLYTLRYAQKVAKDPANSILEPGTWTMPEGSAEFAEAKLDIKDVIVTFLFFAQYIFAVVMILFFGYDMSIYALIQFIISFACGILCKMDTETFGNTFAQGVAGMGFVCFIIGTASALSMVMNESNILDTIVYYIAKPLSNVSPSFAAVGISFVVMCLNFMVPSMSAKIAVLMPLVLPLASALNLNGQIAVQAFQVGDGFTNILTPAETFIIAGLAVTGVPFNKWFKWAAPIVAVMLVLSWVILYALVAVGWTGV